MSAAVTARAWGKVNLLLYCGQVDGRGYHPLRSVFQALDMAETVTIGFAGGESTRVKTRWVGAASAHPGAQILAQLDAAAQKHLAVRAAAAIAERIGEKERALNVEVAKSVPIAGGMAGGSADAAAALIAANELYGAGLTLQQLAEIGAGLGADVPFCLYGGTAAASGYADQISPLPPGPRRHWVVALAKRGLETPRVFREIDESGRGREVLPEIAPQTKLDLLDPDPVRLAAVMHNDLEAAAVSLRPELREVIDAARAAGALTAIVSGSGPSIVALAGDAQAAVKIAGDLEQNPHVAAAITTAGPAPRPALSER